MLSAPSTIAYTSAITLRPALAAPGRSRAQPHQLLRQRLDPQPLRERRDQRHAGVRDDSLVVEHDLQPIQSDRLRHRAPSR